MSTALKGNRKSINRGSVSDSRDMAPRRGLFSERSAMTRMRVITREESAPPGNESRCPFGLVQSPTVPADNDRM